MKVYVTANAEALGAAAARESAQIIRAAIREKGCARIILSTGASQFTTLEALVSQPDIDWKKVEMFHLDEYVNLPETHPASFRKYLRERFVNKTQVGAYHFVDGTPECVDALEKLLREAPIDLGLIGIGQNSHIAFNDPPADFDTDRAYIIVNLDARCRGQQVFEGWFKTLDDVPAQAVSMTVKQIMRCERIISAVPYPEKADAVALTLNKPLSNRFPATMLKEHPHASLYADADSFAKVDEGNLISGIANPELTVERL